MSSIHIREATPDDLDVIVQFNRELAWESEAVRLEPIVLRNGVSALLSDPRKGRYFVAEHDKEPIGQLMITYEWSDWRNGFFLWLQSVYVVPRWRKQGVFRELFRYIEHRQRDWGSVGLRLYVHQGNARAREVYARLGMTPSEYVLLETRDPLR